MRMSNNSYNHMNALIAMCFQANAIIDNLAYNLDYHYFNNIANIVHLNVAHVMPQWADLISDQMLQLSARPVRHGISGYEDDIPDVTQVFSKLNKILVEICDAVKNTIEDADMAEDAEVRIFCEDFLMKIQPFLKQSEEWMNAAATLDATSLNIHIKDYTHYIGL